MGSSSDGKVPYLAVEIERRRLEPLVPLDQGRCSRSLRLTTLVDNQRQARVRLFVVCDAEPLLLREFFLDNLPRQPKGEPRFTVSCDFDGLRRAGIVLQSRGDRQEASLDLRKYISPPRKGRVFMVLFLLAVLLLLGIAGFFLVSPFKESSVTPPPGRAGQIPEAVSSRDVSDSAREPEHSAPVAESLDPPPDDTVPEEIAPPDVSGLPSDSEPGESGEAPPPEPIPVSRDTVIYFTPDSPLVTQKARDEISQFVATLRPITNLAITIEGHCALAGTETGREELSRNRAHNTKQAILQEASWIEPEHVTPLWYAANRPVTRLPAEQDRNRRVEILVRGEILPEE
ncbi:Outer membrane protein OmpA [Alkalispirochaeta americana]|uniref:Outer membrane protein OmpA n=1 Tax=Alkalispirochaeta americana TaxID=159291 RepID=A0A1N6P5G2_9SPIO|nr:OmpA family protein [Alkalispirochaeta americana]SIP99507.1 Outer membrane protein OmpA [Alkalispirochaeta americana]